MTTPLMFLDFDGVINCFPAAKVLRRGGVGHTGWLKPADPRAALYAGDRAYRLDGNVQARTGRGRFRVHWSRELVHGLDALDADRRWLTTWQPYCRTVVNPMLDVDWPAEHWYDPVSGEGRWTGKRRAVFDAIRDGSRPVIWVDDEEVDDNIAIQVESLFPSHPVLLVATRQEIGVSRRQFGVIRRFCADLSAFPAVTLDVEPGWTRYAEHRGL